MKGKKLKLLGIVALMMISLTGCGEELKTFATSDLGQQLDYRFNENQAIVDSLYANELISENVYKDVSKSIEAQRDKYLSKDENGNYHANIEIDDDGKFKSGEIIKSISELRNVDNTILPEVTKSDGTVAAIEESIELSNYVISNYITGPHCWNIEDKKYNNWQKILNSRVEPVKIIDSEALTFTDNIDCDVYVLKKEIFTADNSGGIDGLIELLGTNSDIRKIKNINDYFEKATYLEDVRDSSGTIIHRKGDTITIRDLLNIDSLVGNSKPYDGAVIPTGEHGESGNRPGYDMLVKQYNEPVLKIRMEEFNIDEINKFMVAMGIDGGDYSNTGKWEFVHDNGLNKAYLMEYPVYYISGMKSTADNNFEELILSESDLGVNIKTGKTLAYIRDSEGNVEFTRIIENSGEGYLELAGAINERVDSQSAYIVAGSTEINLNMSDNSNSVKTRTGRLVLRDYLEATYAPEFKAYTSNSGTSDEKVVVFGRKIRFTNILKEPVGNQGDVILKVNKTNSCAIFVDKNGVIVKDTPELYVSDFCDFNSLLEDKVLRPTGSGESETEMQITENIEDAKVATDLNWQSTKGEIVISSKFPGESIGNKDYIRDTQARYSPELQKKQHQTFYAVATTSNMFTTSLFSSWVNNKSSEASLRWWREWLSSNSYIYKIDSTSLEEYLYNNYKYELAQNDIVILDLEVVAKIQEEMDKEATENTNRLFRTVFKVLGWLLIIYAVLLMLCWLIDTNIDVGVQLTNKLTFGQIIPIKYDSDIPLIDAENRHYVALSGMAIRGLVLITVGLICILTDPYKIALFLIKTFGKFAEAVSKMISGM